MKQRIRHFIYLILLVLADQASKYWAYIPEKERACQ